VGVGAGARLVAGMVGAVEVAVAGAGAGTVAAVTRSVAARAFPVDLKPQQSSHFPATFPRSSDDGGNSLVELDCSRNAAALLSPVSRAHVRTRACSSRIKKALAEIQCYGCLDMLRARGSSLANITCCNHYLGPARAAQVLQPLPVGGCLALKSSCTVGSPPLSK